MLQIILIVFSDRYTNNFTTHLESNFNSKTLLQTKDLRHIHRSAKCGFTRSELYCRFTTFSKAYSNYA